MDLACQQSQRSLRELLDLSTHDILDLDFSFCVRTEGTGVMGTKRLRYAADFHAQAAEFSLVSLPDKLLTTIVEQDGRCERASPGAASFPTGLTLVRLLRPPG